MLKAARSPSGGRPQVPLHGPAGAAEFGGDRVDRPTSGPEPSRSDGPIRRRRLRRFEPEERGDTVAVLGTEPAVPSLTGAGVLGSQGGRQAGEASWTASAPSHDVVVRPALVRVEGVGVHPAARGGAELTIQGRGIGVVDQCAKLGLAAGEKVRVMHGVCSSSRPMSGHRLGSGELGRFPAHPLGAFRARPGVAQAARTKS
jgi:hypothetical protein